jgi:hypothetical protein
VLDAVKRLAWLRELTELASGHAKKRDLVRQLDRFKVLDQITLLLSTKPKAEMFIVVFNHIV